MQGKILKFGDGYGFISSEQLESNLFFHISDVTDRQDSLIQEGDLIDFEIGENQRGPCAKQITRINLTNSKNSAKKVSKLLGWAYLGQIPDTIRQLEDIAIDERWEFKNQGIDPEKPFPILYSYLLQTFTRLMLEDKIKYSDDGQFAAFNTGLVDSRYETIYAIFNRNTYDQPQWKIIEFCIAGEKAAGQDLVRYFNPLPESAHYFDEPTDLIYDVRQGDPELDFKHIIIDRLDRYPMEFLEDNSPRDFSLKDPRNLNSDEKEKYSKELGKAVEDDPRVYRRIMNRVKDAVELSIKRVSWNFKTAVPQYYPRVKKLQLLLPLCLVDDNHVDLALAVEKTCSGNYLGHTVLTLDWAYSNARLVCRPDSDWLEPKEIETDNLNDSDSEIGEG